MYARVCVRAHAYWVAMGSSIIFVPNFIHNKLESILHVSWFLLSFLKNLVFKVGACVSVTYGGLHLKRRGSWSASKNQNMILFAELLKFIVRLQFLLKYIHMLLVKVKKEKYLSSVEHRKT